MPIRVPAGLARTVVKAVRDDLSRRFPGANVGIRSFRSELNAMARPGSPGKIGVTQVVSFRGLGTESKKAAGSPYPVGTGEEFTFKGVWKEAEGLVTLTLKKLGSLRF